MSSNFIKNRLFIVSQNNSGAAGLIFARFFKLTTGSVIKQWNLYPTNPTQTKFTSSNNYIAIFVLNNWIYLCTSEATNFNLVWNMTPGYNFTDVRITDELLFIAIPYGIIQYNLTNRVKLTQITVSMIKPFLLIT